MVAFFVPWSWNIIRTTEGRGEAAFSKRIVTQRMQRKVETKVMSLHRLSSFVRGVGLAGSLPMHRPVRRSLLRPRILASSACWQTLQTPAAPQVTRRSLDTKKTYREMMEELVVL